MMKTTRLLAVLVALSYAAPDRGRAATIPPSVSVNVVSHGVKLTLRVARRTFPRDALISVGVSLENVSHKFKTVPPRAALAAAVLDESGHEVYSPFTPFGDDTIQGLGGKKMPNVTLLPHRSVRTHYFLILRGPLVQASASLVSSGNPIDIHGKPLRLTLTAETPPVVTVSDSPTVHASIVFAPGVRGTFYLTQQTRCESPTDVLTTRDDWGSAPAHDHFPPFSEACTGKRSWFALAAHLNHAAAFIDYESSAPTQREVAPIYVYRPLRGGNLAKG